MMSLIKYIGDQPRECVNVYNKIILPGTLIADVSLKSVALLEPYNHILYQVPNGGPPIVKFEA